MKTKTKQRNFLTLKEVKAQGLYYHVYTEDESVYKYEIVGKGYTLVEDDVILCENVDNCHWYAKGVYKYKIKGKGETLKQNGKILCENVARCNWHSKGAYEYRLMTYGNMVKVGF